VGNDKNKSEGWEAYIFLMMAFIYGVTKYSKKNPWDYEGVMLNLPLV